METRLRTFDELSAGELYELLRLRSAVFVVEQQCIYLDLDGKDARALHLLGYEGEKLAAYTRIFAPGDYFEEASIGRVAVSPDFRGLGLGREIMQASLAAVEVRFGPVPICLSAQSYLRRFYEELGFRVEGDEYLEDGIPHIMMLKG
jgi:ElaA protein